jgi:predicted kinase
VIVDAAFLRQEERNNFYRLAAQSGVDFSIIAPHAPDDQMIARIKHRLAEKQDASEATPDVLKKQKTIIEPLSNEELKWVNTTGDKGER